MLTEKKLNEIRARKLDPLKYHNVLIAQSDREALLGHIDHLNKLLEAAEIEKGRLRRSLD